MNTSSSSTSNWMFNHHSTFTSSSISYHHNLTLKITNSTIQTPSTLRFSDQSPIKSPSSSSSSSSSPLKHNLFQKAAAMAFDAIENRLITHEKRTHLPKTKDPNHQLAGNFSAVPDHPVSHNLPLTGKIPHHIQGVYLRNGANPFFTPTSGHHLFDGDSMIHAVTFNNGSASYACRFTDTRRLVQERAVGRPVFPKTIGELHGPWGIVKLIMLYARGLCGLVDCTHGTGVANAGLIYFNKHVLAMSEDDMPYHVRVTDKGDLETVGRYNFDDQLNSTMIAHPKLDPVSGEMFALSYNIVKKPYLKYFRFSPEGKKSEDVDIDLGTPTMVHDFAITENFVVVPDHQVVFKVSEMMTGGSPVMCDGEKVSRFGVLGKYDSNGSGMRWIDVPGCFCFHIWNAWEVAESEEVVVIGSCMTPADSIFNESKEELKSVLSEIRLNLRTGESSRRAILSPENDVNLEAGMVNKNLLGRRTRYAYLAVAEPWPKVSGFAKVDLFTGKMSKFIYGESKYGGEPLFLPSSDDEEDGHILAFVHDECTWESELQIVNAKTLKLEATVKLPSRVPYGFHGTFVTADDLATQA